MIVKLGIIGTGSRTQDYLDLRQGDSLFGFEVAALADNNEQRLKEFAAKHFPNTAGLDLYTDYRNMLEDSNIDAVLICTPDTTHKQIAIACLRHEKHILLEKPLATTVEDCLAIYKESLKHSVVVKLAFGLRYSAFYAKIKEIVSSGVLGRMMLVEAKESLGYIHAGSFFRRWQRFRKNNGGFLNYKCCHDLDILNWIIDSEPEYVSSFGSRSYFNPLEGASERCEDCQLKSTCKFVFVAEDYYELFGQFNSIEDICVFNSDKNIIDHQVVNVQYKNDVTLSFNVSMLSAQSNKTLVIFGSEATLYADMRRKSIEVKTIHPFSEVLQNFEIQQENSDAKLFKTFYSEIQNPSKAGSSDARAALLSSGIALLAEMSMEQKTAIYVPKLLELEEGTKG